MKRFVVFICILLSLSSLLFAAEVSFDFLAFRSSESNIYSNPLPMNGSNSYLQYLVEHPFLDRTDYGAKLNVNLFFVPASRAGLSFSFAYGVVAKATEHVPVVKGEGDFNSSTPVDWEYEGRDAYPEQIDKISLSIGPVFRFNYSVVELGGAVRFAISSFDYFETFTVGLELQPYIRAYFKPWVYASAGLSFTAHLFHFIKDESMLYEPNYTFVSLTPFIGFGFRFGGVQ